MLVTILTSSLLSTLGHENNAAIMPVLDLAQRQYGGEFFKP